MTKIAIIVAAVTFFLMDSHHLIFAESTGKLMVTATVVARVTQSVIYQKARIEITEKITEWFLPKNSSL